MRYRSYQGFSLNAIWVIIIIVFMFFIATIISPEIRFRLGLVPIAFLSRPWTIITALFVHANFWHLFGNMITLYFFGTFLARLVGDRKFLMVYFAGGLLGNILYLLLGTPVSVAIGASGAVYSLAGALVMMMTNLRVFLY